jgi:hypothetical protein
MQLGFTKRKKPFDAIYRKNDCLKRRLNPALPLEQHLHPKGPARRTVITWCLKVTAGLLQN